MPIRLPALGLSVLQLQPDLDGPYTLQSSVRVYLNGVKLSVSRQTAFPLRVVESGTSDFAISNRYMQVWFSGLTGLLKVKGQAKGGGEGPEEGMGVGACIQLSLLPCASCHLTLRDLGVSISRCQANSLARLSVLIIFYLISDV